MTYSTLKSHVVPFFFSFSLVENSKSLPMTITSKQPTNIVRTLLFCDIHETDSDYNHFKLEKSIGTNRYGQDSRAHSYIPFVFPSRKGMNHEKSFRCKACKAMTKYT